MEIHGKLYQCKLHDLFDQRMVGWSMHDRQDRHMVILPVQMAVWQRQGDEQVMLHSDHDNQFRSGDYHEHLSDRGLIYSMAQ